MAHAQVKTQWSSWLTGQSAIPEPYIIKTMSLKKTIWHVAPYFLNEDRYYIQL